MEIKIIRENRKACLIVFVSLTAVIFLGGCELFSGYSNESLYPEGVESVYLEMFDNQSFQRGVEYKLTDALGKRIEAETGYKIISNRNKADSIISGQITSVREAVFTTERESGRALEKDVEVAAVVNWKNLRTGELLIDNTSVSASSSYSEWQSQGIDYASSLSANKLAERIVELMEKQW